MRLRYLWMVVLATQAALVGQALGQDSMWNDYSAQQRARAQKTQPVQTSGARATLQDQAAPQEQANNYLAGSSVGCDSCGGCDGCDSCSGCTSGCDGGDGCDSCGGGGRVIDRLGNGGLLAGCGLFGNGGGLGGGCDAGCDSGCDSGCCGTSCGGGCGCCPKRYVQLFGGYFDPRPISTDFSYDIIQVGQGTGSIDLHTNSGYALGASFGKYLNCRLRGEVDFTFRNASFERVDFSLGGPVASVPVGGKLNMYSFMGNLYFDINRCGLISPYVGAGVGFVFNRADIIEPTIPVTLDLDWSSFAYQLMVGASVRLTDRTSAFAEYRYFATDKFQLGVGTPVGSFGAESDISAHNGFVGLRIDLR